MTSKQAAFLTSRVVSLWFIYHAVFAVMAIPSSISNFMLASEMTNSSLPILHFGNHLIGHAVVEILSSFAYAVADMLLAIIFFKFGPRVSRFLIGDSAANSAQEAAI